MKKCLLLAVLFFPVIAYCQRSADSLVVLRIDSIFHTSYSYAKAVKKIAAISDRHQLYWIVVHFDSSDGKGNYFTDEHGNDLDRDMVCYRVGYSTDGTYDHAKFLYYTYYSRKRNSIEHFSKKESWKHAHW